MTTNVPAIYQASGHDDLVGALLDVAKREPGYRPLLVRAIGELLGTRSEVTPPTGGGIDGITKPRRRRRKGGAKQKQRAPRSTRASSAQTGKPDALDGMHAEKMSAHGIELAIGENPGVGFKGRTTEIEPRQALLMKLLMRGMPNPIDRTFLGSKIFPNQVKQSADVSLGVLAGKTNEAVATIGLEVHNVRGVGIVLRPLET